MSQHDKIKGSVLNGRQDKNVLFSDLCSLLERFGSVCRIRGDHYIFTKDGVAEIINLQPLGNKAKPYQVKQVRELILQYRLGGDDDEQV